MEKELLLYTDNGKQVDKLNINIDVNQREESPKTYSCAIRRLRQNWRQGTVGCKDRSEVSFSNKKPWKQKGTGRARAGTARSPLWRSGGVTFGPQARVRILDINKKQDKLVLNNIFFSKLNKNELTCIDFALKSDKPSTKEVRDFLRNANLYNKKIILFLPFNDELNFASFRNLANVDVLSFDQPNAFDLSSGRHWVFLKRDIDLFKNMVAKWN
ncbi:MAG: 50S ribosomal protein L4 [bacterium]